MTTSIRMRAEDQEDLKVVSTCLQDAIVPIGDMCYLPDEKRFVAVVSRFRWEACGRPHQGLGPTAEDDELYPYERVQCGVRFEGVTGVKTRGLDLKDRKQFLELLSVEAVEGGVTLHFAGGGCIRLDGGAWHCLIEDLGEPWPTACKPCHPIDE
ncbi:MAG TPA: DUF2948 family protein [Azospirillum sp.]|nr:DUF2948 family protein [Azospirillum sp.]